jgi:hypothetical protein
MVVLAGLAMGQDKPPDKAPDQAAVCVSNPGDQEKGEQPSIRNSNQSQPKTPAQVASIVQGWPECDEYISASRCKVTVNMSNVPENLLNEDKTHGPFMPRAHWDVQVKPFIHLKAIPRGEAAVVLKHTSPFLRCTVAATPAAPTRDLSANIGSLLTAVAGIGATPLTNANALDLQAQLARVEVAGPPAAQLPDLEPVPGTATSIPELDAIEQQTRDTWTEAETDFQAIKTSYKDLRTAITNDWKYTFWAQDNVRLAIADLKKAIPPVKNALDAFVQVGGDLSLLETKALRFERDLLPLHPEAVERFRADQRNIVRLKVHIDVLKDHLSDFGDNRKQMAGLQAFLEGLDATSDYSQQILPMAYFSGKTVTETISCKDAMSKDPVGDNIIFTAYYESSPHWEVSVGAIGSLLGGRQVGTLTEPYTPANATLCAAETATAMANATAAPTCGPTTVLGYTTKSAYQFMPGVFVEQRLKNFHCWGTENGAPWHPFGYLCSIGFAEGVAINPNNGGPRAEFFEGISFGIQRFAILIGFHNGRYQEFGGGYFAGEVFPSGTTVTPPTAYGWATHPAFGIAYRIPPR